MAIHEDQVAVGAEAAQRMDEIPTEFTGVICTSNWAVVGVVAGLNCGSWLSRTRCSVPSGSQGL
jgi:hypothetical protein